MSSTDPNFRDYNEIHDPFTAFHIGNEIAITLKPLPEKNLDGRLLVTRSITAPLDQEDIDFGGIFIEYLDVTGAGHNPLTIEAVVPGQRVQGRIIAIYRTSMAIRIGASINAQVHITE